MKLYRYLLIFGCLIICQWSLAENSEMCSNAGTYSVEIPRKLFFCGEKIDLTRWDLRERIDRELLAMNYMHSNSLQIIKRANRYFPIIEPILRAHHIPEDMKYLCCIESALNPKSVSPAGATGLWQFMANTGKEYGLEVSSQVDERYHIEKSTVAACAYFKDAYERFHDWSLVAASYNAGFRRITTALEKQGVDSYYDLYLSEESSRYVYRILAAKVFMENPMQYGFHIKAEHLYYPLAYRYVSISSSVPDWIAFAKKHGTTYKQLKEANLWIRDVLLDNPGGKLYQVAIPLQESMFEHNNSSIYDKRWVKE